MNKSSNWSKEEIKLAFILYCQLPFGRMHSKNNDVIQLATHIGRSPSAVAMKLVNLASLDPVIKASGRAGLGNASKLDEIVWNEFHSNWNLEVDRHLEVISNLGLLGNSDIENVSHPNDPLVENYSSGYQLVNSKQRLRQSFFRKSILSCYKETCCMSGVTDPILLIASHIVPWSIDSSNRLNPRNGLCLSVLHDKAFDQGLISLSDQLTVLVSPRLKKQNNDLIQQALISLEGKLISVAEKFKPELSLIQWHRTNIFNKK